MSEAIAGMRRKLLRAEAHFKVIDEVASRFRYCDCQIVPEQNQKKPDFIDFRVRLPPLPDDFVMVVGDCIHNLRAVLDHAVWQLAHRSAPNRSPQQRKANMFPICAMHGEFRAQEQRGRLNGLPPSAIALVESMQPYHAGYELLGVLGELNNIDKHRALMVITTVGSVWFVERFKQMGFALPGIWHESLNDGDLCFSADKRVLTPSLGADFGKSNLNARATVAIAFKDAPADGFSVQGVLESLIDFMGNGAIPAFEPFFD